MEAHYNSQFCVSFNIVSTGSLKMPINWSKFVLSLSLLFSKVCYFNTLTRLSQVNWMFRNVWWAPLYLWRPVIVLTAKLFLCKVSACFWVPFVAFLISAYLISADGVIMDHCALGSKLTLASLVVFADYSFCFKNCVPLFYLEKYL